MGKGMTAKKKKRPNRVVTQRELINAQNKIDKEIDELKITTTQDGTLYSQSLIYLALHNVYGFGVERIRKVQEEADRLADRISDPEDYYCFDNIWDELEKIGVGVVRR